MNVLKLVVGWLFLAGLTAGGTYYAMDEVDHRIGLARFQLHEKLGITRYAGGQIQLPPIQPPVVTPSPTVVQPPIVPPQVVPPPTVPPGTSPPSVNPGVTPPPYSNPNPAPVNPNPAPVNPAPGPAQPPTRVIPPPANPQPQPPRNAPVYNPTQQPPAARPSDFNETNERLIEVKSRAEAVQRTWQTRRPAYGTLRPEIQAALSALRRYSQAAEQALRAGDTATARRNLDQAEKQMDILKDFE